MLEIEIYATNHSTYKELPALKLTERYIVFSATAVEINKHTTETNVCVDALFFRENKTSNIHAPDLRSQNIVDGKACNS